MSEEVETLSIAPSVDLAVYIVPPPAHPLTEQGRHLLGYDVWSGETFPDEEARWPGFVVEDVRRIRSLPRPYGVHITVSDAFEYPVGAITQIAERLEAITSQLAPFTLRGASYDREFADSSLVLTWQEGIDHLHRLATAIAVHVNTQRQRHGRITVPMTTRPDLLRDWAIETTFGHYWTIDKYHPHLTLANGLHGRPERDQLWASWQRSGLIGDMNDFTLNVDCVYLMTRRTASVYWVIHPNFEEGFALRGQRGRTSPLSSPAPIRGTAPLNK